MPTGMGYKAGSIARVINSMANMLEAFSAEQMREQLMKISGEQSLDVRFQEF